MRFEEFISDIKSSMKQYDSANLIDELTVYNWVLECLKRFGSLTTVRHEVVLPVKNGKVELPASFKSLKLALKCSPNKIEFEDDCEDVLQSSMFYKTFDYKHSESVCSSDDYLNLSDCDKEFNELMSSDIKSASITESVYLNKKHRIEAKYDRLIPLTLISYAKSDVDKSFCPNVKLKKSPYQISINKRTLHCNFTDGYVFVIFNGYEEDEDGFVEIPDTNNGWLKQYIDYHVKRRIIEDVLTNSDNSTNEVSLYQLFQTNELQCYSNAKTELKFKGINSAINKYKKKIKREMSIYNIGVIR